MSSSPEKKPSTPKAKKPTKPASSAGPKTVDMVVDAITTINDKKGASIQAIKAFILEKYPNVDPNRLRTLLKRAVVKGMESGLIVRPKSSDANGTAMTGRLKVDKAKLAALEKEKKPKKKEKPATAKSVVQKAAAKKSPTKKIVKKTDKKSPKKMVKSSKSPAKAKVDKKPKTKTMKSPGKSKTVKQPLAKAATRKQPKTPKKPKAPSKQQTKKKN